MLRIRTPAPSPASCTSVGIKADDIKIDYSPISPARRMSGLRIVLGAFAIPGPLARGMQNVSQVKGLDYTPIRNSNQDASDLQIGSDGGQIASALTTALRAHRDFIYEAHLGLPRFGGHRVYDAAISC